MKQARCPSCGAPVVFLSATSLYVVCEFCRSTLLRSGEDLQNLGRMADLLDDLTPLQIGSEGVFRGRHFAIIGRIQLQYDAGIWNEWYLLFDDGRSAWLSEAAGEYIVSGQVNVAEPPPAFDSLRPEMPVTLDGRVFEVTDLKTARCIAGQGELPFKVAAGYDVNTADLRSADRFVTLDYSETPPLVFVGHAVAFADLRLSNLRAAEALDTGQPSAKARVFNCPHCAAPLSLRSGVIKTVACDSCGSLIGIENENFRLLQYAQQALRVVPWLPLGSRGTIESISWEVIGFMQRRPPDEETTWSEYLLFDGDHGFAWLIEDQGHWNFARSLSKPPAVGRRQREFIRNGEKFKRFSKGQAKVSYVVGQFYWRVAVDDLCRVEEFICPPRLLVREVTDSESLWSEAEYLQPEAVATAFGVTNPPPPRRGVYANQPNPRADSHRRICRFFWLLAGVATVLQLLFLLTFAAQTVLKQSLVISAANPEGTWTSPELVLKSRARSLLLSHRTDLRNNWLSLTTLLVEKNTGQSYVGSQELGRYEGVDDGEIWIEGQRSEQMVFQSIPPGTYQLVVEYELGKENSQSVIDVVELERNPMGWSNYGLLLVFIVCFPLFSLWRHNAFESRRWSGSNLDKAAN
ncbi:MAG TPA: DUF4178 domain-containing protein [Accumulibacter sp.]|nr:DUF4178 domain-containing protein [Accumulibacter sp.]HMW18195.1 DUF4178 domain-containing protein [Accumulibacter sp.]HMX22321.1 DUF4178 domain-containing protein [Accumulibacter sp.]HMY05575.1 DUF4178 domain-containing protein [Accumulibacter sp.]HNC18310.1 DUF4178 domain-containing protein [Accumulibacter sp.]